MLRRSTADEIDEVRMTTFLRSPDRPSARMFRQPQDPKTAKARQRLRTAAWRKDNDDKGRPTTEVIGKALLLAVVESADFQAFMDAELSIVMLACNSAPAPCECHGPCRRGLVDQSDAGGRTFVDEGSVARRNVDDLQRDPIRREAPLREPDLELVEGVFLVRRKIVRSGVARCDRLEDLGRHDAGQIEMDAEQFRRA
ncbi:hypothetical protein H8A95_09255 [Bradyrhizobium sp. Pear76]|uniref:hypothetical protein n=1 Tax=Bradyrhizobium oropedii TaxID=1571201 RepID=UPI003B848930|nr:hypothetical protein [Bradyrhizobium oropedii]